MRKRTVAVIVLALTFAVTLSAVATAQIRLGPQIGSGLPPRPKPANDTVGGEVQTMPELTEEEKERFINIIMSNDSVRRILDKANWTIRHMGPRTEGEERLGALIVFDTAVWVEGTFNMPSAIPYTAKLWVGNLHVFVDLGTNSTVGLEPGIGKAMDKVPLDEELAAAEKIALNHTLVKSLGEDIESYLNAVYYIPEYIKGMAIFSIRSDREEVMVTIDLDKMVVVEKHTVRVAPGPTWGPPPPPKPANDTVGGEVEPVPELTEEEKERFISIIMSNDSVRRILDKGNWTIFLIGPWTEGGEKVGVGAVIKLDKFVWVEGTFNNPSFSYTAKLWTRTIHISVDLRTNSTVRLNPGMGKAIDKVPLDEELAAAEKIALNHTLVKSLGEDIESYLNAVYYIPEYPKGVAFFSIFSDRGEWLMVTIDLEKMMALEKYTGSILVPGQPVKPPRIVLSEKEIIPNPNHTSSISFTAWVEYPLTINIWFEIKANFTERGVRFSAGIENVRINYTRRLTIVFVDPDDARFEKLSALEGDTIYMTDPCWHDFDWPRDWVYGITTDYYSWERALTGYMGELAS